MRRGRCGHQDIGEEGEGWPSRYRGGGGGTGHMCGNVV